MSVFISYSSRESDDANLIKSILNKNGIEVWMAPNSIPAGSNYTREIPRAIKKCSVFLLLLSQSAQDSKWVSAEVENAFKNGKIIIPFVLEECPLNDDFDFLLSRSQRIAAYEKKSESLEALVSEIKTILGIKNEKGLTKISTEMSTDTKKVNISAGEEIAKKAREEEKNKKLAEQMAILERLQAAAKAQNSAKTLDKPTKTIRKPTEPVTRVNLTFNNGIYEGDFVSNMRTGKGKFTYTNGDVYEGDFINGTHSGKGKFTWSNGNVYDGDFIDGIRTGNGRFIWNNGDVYEGDFIRGKRTGKGKYSWKNGNSYEGEFKDGYFCGEGIFKSNSCTKKGIWKNNQLVNGFEYDFKGNLIAKYLNKKRVE